nr:SLATT domain-containing protein [Dechloromonas sp.]
MNPIQTTDQAMIAALRREAERIEEDATYSSKSHFNAEDTWVRRHYWLGVPATALAAIAGAALVKSQPEWASALTLLASLLTGLMTFLKPNERAAMHRAAAGQFLALKNDARLFREVDLLQMHQLDELPDRLKALSATRNELNQKSPSIPRGAFVAARKGIEEGEATHKVDKGE